MQTDGHGCPVYAESTADEAEPQQVSLVHSEWISPVGMAFQSSAVEMEYWVALANEVAAETAVNVYATGARSYQEP